MPLLTALVLAVLCLVPAAAQAQEAEETGSSSVGWVSLDYGPIVARRVPTHSGEGLGQVLDRLGGRPAPPRGDGSADAADHQLIDPLLEPYAHVLPDLVDTLAGGPERPWIEIGWLWEPGEAAPAWVELLRARRAVVETDGEGEVRIFVPAAGDGEAERGLPAERAWHAERAWLRHVLQAERGRLEAAGVEDPSLRVSVYAYRHDPARTRFELHLEPHVVTAGATDPPRQVPPLDLTALERFLDRGLELEGGRLDEGRLRLIGSEAPKPPALLGEPLSLADLAVAYRAVMRGGRPRPYMSLDRGLSPHRSRVNYGGRLADTRLGLVSLLCDVRFKTFSQGIDPHTGENVRPSIRKRVPGFETHIERFAHHPQRGERGGQQTRLWFYPDDVRMLVDPEARMVALTRPRMTAAAERVQLGEQGAPTDQPPWTRALTGQVNETYDALSREFPELADLDRTVRLLGLFTWLDFAKRQGRAVPDLDALLAVELPALRTPRRFPQLLALDAFPKKPGQEGPVDVFHRPEVSAALDRLMPRDGSMLPARARLFRALAALDRDNPSHARLLEQISGVRPSQLGRAQVDQLAYQAERLRMHGLVVSRLSADQRAQLERREAGGQPIKVLSVAIGGLDLGLGSALARGAGSSRPLGLGGGTGSIAPASRGGGSMAITGSMAGAAASGPKAEPSEDWAQESPGLPRALAPPLGDEQTSARVRRWVHRDEDGQTVGVVHLPLSPDVRARTVRSGDGEAPVTIDRVEGWRRTVYRIEGSGERFRTRPVDISQPPPSAVADRLAADPPQTLATLSLSRIGRAAAGGSGSTGVRLHARAPGRPPRATDVPRRAFQAFVLGPRLAPRAARGILAEIRQLTGGAPEIGTVMVMEDFDRLGAPWRLSVPPRPGEEHPLHVADAISRTGTSGARKGAVGVVGLDPKGSVERWSGAATRLDRAVLWLPDGAFEGPAGRIARELREAWPDGRVVDELPEEGDLPGLVVLASAEPPGRLGERVRRLAEQPRMAGRHLGVLALSGRLRWDAIAETLADSPLASVGISGAEAFAWQGIPARIEQFARSLEAVGDAPTRPERLAGPFVWIY